LALVTQEAHIFFSDGGRFSKAARVLKSRGETSMRGILARGLDFSTAPPIIKL